MLKKDIETTRLNILQRKNEHILKCHMLADQFPKDSESYEVRWETEGSR
jgi:hypothetical protein